MDSYYGAQQDCDINRLYALMPFVRDNTLARLDIRVEFVQDASVWKLDDTAMISQRSAEEIAKCERGRRQETRNQPTTLLIQKAVIGHIPPFKNFRQDHLRQYMVVLMNGRV